MSAELQQLDAAAPEDFPPSLFELPEPALSKANDDIQDCIYLGDLAKIDAILSQWRDLENPTLLTPDARKHLNACPLVAMETGQFRLAQDLLEKGVYVDSRCSSPAIKHALDTNSTVILEMLLDHGWDIEQVFNTVENDVLKALYQDEVLVEWLLSHGASLNARSPLGLAPMERAARYAPFSLLKLFVERGGRVQSTDVIVKAAIAEVEGMPDRIELVKYLVGLGAPIDAFNVQFCDYKKAMSMVLMGGKLTALHHAAQAGRSDMVALLLKIGADKSQATFAHKTALDLAVEKGHGDIGLMLQE